jgi:hypothetical protein
MTPAMVDKVAMRPNTSAKAPVEASAIDTTADSRNAT